MDQITTTTTTGNLPPGAAAAILAGGAVIWLGVLVINIICLIGMWKVFTKAGKPGWAAIIPFYNLFVLMEIVGRPTWWFVLLIIPFVNIIPAIMVMLDLARSFGKSDGFAVGLILLGPIFICILGFGDAVYRGPAAATIGSQPTMIGTPGS